MPLIPNTYNEARYTHYRDVVVLMSDVQKVQAALIPDGVNPADYEILVSEQSSNGDIVYYNYYPTWTTLPALPNFADFVPLASCQIDTATGSTGPVPPSVTAWYQFRLTVRKKSNHADMATGVIRLVPTVNLNNGGGSPATSLLSWKGSYMGEHWTGSWGVFARSELELRLHNNGSWQVWHYRGTSKTPTLKADGVWLPAGHSASRYTFTYSSVTGAFATSLQQNTYLPIPTLEKYHRVSSWIGANIDSSSMEEIMRMTMVLGIKDTSTGEVNSAAINFENSVWE